VLAGDGVASVRFGESTSAAIAGLDRLLGHPPKGPVSETGNCNIDAAQQWSGLTGFFNKGEFVGYSTGERLTRGSWSVPTRSGKLIGYLSAEPDQPGPVPTITSIEAGSVGCPAATP